MDVQLYGTGLSVNVTVLSGAKSVRVIVRDSTQKRYTKKGEMYTGVFRRMMAIVFVRLIINPLRMRRRVTVVVRVCVSVCHISPLERLFVLKILSHTQRATKVKKFVGFSLKPLRSKVMVSFAYP